MKYEDRQGIGSDCTCITEPTVLCTQCTCMPMNATYPIELL